ncbi:hypothetical protein [Umezawaea sp.]
MLLRPAYLSATNAFAPPHLLPMSGRDEDVKPWCHDTRISR